MKRKRKVEKKGRKGRDTLKSYKENTTFVCRYLSTKYAYFVATKAREKKKSALYALKIVRGCIKLNSITTKTLPNLL